VHERLFHLSAVGGVDVFFHHDDVVLAILRALLPKAPQRSALAAAGSFLI
jgi:hypothetical protein